MAKSKAVKQAEALERKRKLYPQKLDLSARSRFGGDIYDGILQRRGKDAADANNKQAQLLFSKYLKEAQLDSHGNPVTYPKGSLGKEIFYGQTHVYEPGSNSVLEDFIMDQKVKSISQAINEILEEDKPGSSGISIEPYHQAE